MIVHNFLVKNHYKVCTFHLNLNLKSVITSYTYLLFIAFYFLLTFLFYFLTFSYFRIYESCDSSSFSLIKVIYLAVRGIKKYLSNNILSSFIEGV